MTEPLGFAVNAERASQEPEAQWGQRAQVDRVAFARLLLVKLGIPGPDPRWSSAVLDHLIKTSMETPGGTVSDLLFALFELLGEGGDQLSTPLMQLIKEIVVRCFSKHQASFEQTDWTQILEKLNAHPTKPQWFFGSLAIPDELVSAHVARQMASALGLAGHPSQNSGKLVVS